MYETDNMRMGLFSSRPQEPSEWAGLPSEPLRAESEAERLSAAVDVDPAGLVGGGFGSIVIPVEPVSDEPETPDASTTA